MAWERIKIEVIRLWAAMLIGVLSLVLVSTTVINQWYKQKSSGLPAQIKEVEGALKNLRNLETYLEKTKSDMIVTEQAKVKIEEEYKNAKELEPITKKQLQTISLAVNKRTTMNTIKDIFWGVVLGVCGSLLASYIYGFVKSRKQVIKVKEVEQ